MFGFLSCACAGANTLHDNAAASAKDFTPRIFMTDILPLLAVRRPEQAWREHSTDFDGSAARKVQTMTPEHLVFD